MEEAGFPGQHTTTTVTSSTTVQTNIRFDSSYIRTIPGILKVIQVVASFFGFICIQISEFNYSSQGSYFSVIAGISFWVTGILLCLYLFHIIEKFYKIPWLTLEFYFCALWAFLYLIAASVVVSFSYFQAFVAAGVFGFIATVAYAIDAFLKWSGSRAGGLAQGSRVVSKQTTSTAVTDSERPEGY